MAKDNRRSTGISGLDLAIEGGFPLGASIVVQGSPLTGIDHMARQFWSVDGNTGSYLMIDGEVEQGMLNASGLTPDQLVELCKGDRVVVDSLSSIIISRGIDTAIAFFERVKKEISSRDANIMLILYPDLHPSHEEIRIMRIADVVIELKEVIFMNEIERQLAVHKIRRGQVPKRLIPFNITEKGIELSTTSRVV
ncbi:MAG TPA: ATPase domain-containing protein [Methanolinea sp.]|nr:ATPase domain-containing protein [Methanolinea sp.]HQK55896.1 ATPase domain-containing protein [Methanolinea sp.]